MVVSVEYYNGFPNIADFKEKNAQFIQLSEKLKSTEGKMWKQKLLKMYQVIVPKKLFWWNLKHKAQKLLFRLIDWLIHEETVFRL